MYCEGESGGFESAWLKVAVMQRMMHEAMAAAVPTYVLVIDSDAFMRSTYTSLPQWLRINGIVMRNMSWSMMVATEDAVGPFVPGTANMPNTGAMMGYVDPADAPRGRRAIGALETWQRAACTPRCAKFRQEHPWEQGCLFELLASSSELQAEMHVAPGHMNRWNGPWGEFVRHVWGGSGKEIRGWVFTDMINTLQLDVAAAVSRVTEAAIREPVRLDAECA